MPVVSGRPISTAPLMHEAKATVIATMPLANGNVLRVSLGMCRGDRRVDVRVVERVSPAQFASPTRRGVGIPPDVLPALINALVAAQATLATA